MSSIISAIYVETFLEKVMAYDILCEQLNEAPQIIKWGESVDICFTTHLYGDSKNPKVSRGLITIVGENLNRNRGKLLNDYDKFLDYLDNTLGYEIIHHTYSIR